MSFLCVICRDLLKISEEAPPTQHQHLQPDSLSVSNNHTSTTDINNVSSGRKKSKSNSIVATKCGHLFHYPCLSAWLSQSVNLTSDSKMRCPSCKQLIYIYELIQLFPVENGCGNSSTLEQILSTTFQHKMKCTVDRLEHLVRDLHKKDGDNITKGSETPTKSNHRIKESPKKIRVSQLAELMRELESLRGTIQDLNSFIEQHAKLGSVVERQTKEILELKSKNEHLMMLNERLKTTEQMKENGQKGDLRSGSAQKFEQIENVEALCDENNATTKEGAQDHDNLPGTFRNDEKTKKSSNCQKSPAHRSPHRKSVSFVDPFDDFENADVSLIPNNNASIPLDTKDLRVGDKVIWMFEGNPEMGTVKWKGFVGSQINVGVEFERQLGLPIKDHSSEAIQCIFKSKPGHGRLIPVNELALPNNDDNFSQHRLQSSEHGHYYNKHGSNDGTTKRIQVCTHQ